MLVGERRATQRGPRRRRGVTFDGGFSCRCSTAGPTDSFEAIVSGVSACTRTASVFFPLMSSSLRRDFLPGWSDWIGKRTGQPPDTSVMASGRPHADRAWPRGPLAKYSMSRASRQGRVPVLIQCRSSVDPVSIRQHKVRTDTHTG